MFSDEARGSDFRSRKIIMHSHFSVFSGYGSDLQLGIDNDNIKHQAENGRVEFWEFLGRSIDRSNTPNEEVTDFFEKRSEES